MAQCASNARRILAVAGRSDIPVYRGAEGPLLRRANEGWAWHIHGGDALGGVADSVPEPSPDAASVDRVAALEIARRALEAPGEITVLALGRMTNVALALRNRTANRRCTGRGGGNGWRGPRAWERFSGGDGEPARRP